MRIVIQPSDVARAFAKVADCPAFRESAALVAKGGMPVEMLQAMAVSQRNACQFCTDSHVAIARQMGMVAPDGDPLALLDRPSQLSLRGAFTDAEIVELTATVGLIQMLNLFNNCLQVAYRSEYGGPA